MRTEGVHLAGIGTARTGAVTTAEAVQRGWWTEQERERSGLVSISSAGETPAPDLAVEAACAALAGSGVEAAEVCGVFHSSVHPQGPDGWSAPHYINHRTVGRPVLSAEVRNGCVGAFSALELAACFLIAAPERAAALVTAADNFGTPAVDRWNASRQYVLADGGGALVLSRRPGFARLLAVGSVSDPELEFKHRFGEPMFPPGLTTGRRLDFRARMLAFQREAEAGALPPVGDFGDILITCVERTLAEAGVKLADVGRVVHDGFTRDGVRDMFLDPLGLPEDSGIWDYTRTVGHAGPTDMIRGLEHVWRRPAAAAGDLVLLLGCAPGMEAGCAVVEFSRRP